MRLLAIPSRTALRESLFLRKNVFSAAASSSGSRSSPPTTMPRSSGIRAIRTTLGPPLLTTCAAAICEAPIFRPTSSRCRFGAWPCARPSRPSGPLSSFASFSAAFSRRAGRCGAQLLGRLRRRLRSSGHGRPGGGSAISGAERNELLGVGRAGQARRRGRIAPPHRLARGAAAAAAAANRQVGAGVDRPGGSTPSGGSSRPAPAARPAAAIGWETGGAIGAETGARSESPSARRPAGAGRRPSPVLASPAAERQRGALLPSACAGA